MASQKRKSIDLWRKQEVIRWIDSDGGGVPTRAVKHFRSLGWNIDGGAVRKWWRVRADILAADPKTRRLPGAGRKKAAAAKPAAAPAPVAAQSSAVGSEADAQSEQVEQQQPQAMAAAAVATPIMAAGQTEEPAQLVAYQEQIHHHQQQLQEQEQELLKQQQELLKQQQEQSEETVAQLTPAERAVQLLQRSYSGKLPDGDIVEAFDIMLDPMKARIFLVMTPGEQRDLWLLRQIERHHQVNHPTQLQAAVAAAGAAVSAAGDRIV